MGVQEVPVAEPRDGGWAGAEGVSAGDIERQPGLSLESDRLLYSSLGVKTVNS